MSEIIWFKLRPYESKEIPTNFKTAFVRIDGAFGLGQVLIFGDSGQRLTYFINRFETTTCSFTSPMEYFEIFEKVETLNFRFLEYDEHDSYKIDSCAEVNIYVRFV